MFSTLRTKFGIPGIISVIALVFALAGGAFAANNSDDPGATASAKAKKGPRGPKGAAGPAGPAGAAGPQGPKGDAGVAGTNGTNGTNGTDGEDGEDGEDGQNGLPGTSVVSSNEPKGSNCKEGGTKLVAGATTTYACNGSPWTAGGYLPHGVTATGYYSTSDSWANISFPLPLESAPEPIYVDLNAELSKPGCPGLTEGHEGLPTAASGKLCVYGESFSSAFLYFQSSVYNEDFEEHEIGVNGTAQPGGVKLSFSGASLVDGVWAVTAP